MSSIEEGQPIIRDTLLKIVSTYPLIDNHAHNLLDSSTSLSCPLEVCFSEARGEALRDVIETSALKRGVQQLAKLYNCEATLEAIKHITDVKSYEELCVTCFEPTGIQCLLLDDGLDSLDGLRSVESHVGLVKCAKRIVRIEKIAEQVISDLAKSFKTSEELEELVVELKSFRDPLSEKLESLANSDLVVSFKSIAAYRTGLNINSTVNDEAVALSLASFVFKCVKSKKQEIRLVDKILIDYILKLAIDIAVKYDIPIQFHTGFGDNDLDLLTSNPLYLRELIEMYPSAKFVLLHSAYPYTRQAGYLASVYPNVYVDFGLVFPLISATGQQANLKELFELCPSNKILLSTDGHYLPESFYVATVQVRETLGKVLLEFVENSDFTMEEAIKTAKKIMFENSNRLYKLKLTPEITSNQEYVTRISKLTLGKLKNNGVKYIRLGWLDVTNVLRFRAIPIDRFAEYTVSNGVTLIRCLNSLPVYGDIIAKGSGFNSSGEVLLKPDLNTIVHLPYRPAHAFVHTLLENKWTPSDAEYNPMSSRPSYSSVCPRSCLKNVVESARKEFGINFLVGFESEFLLLKGHNDHKPYQPDAVDNTVYGASAALQNNSTVSTIEQIIEVLQNQNIEVEQFHPESAPGQFEIVTGPDNPLTAVDKVVITRQTIYDVAAKNCLKATFIPKPYSDKAGTASHVHISIHETDPSKKVYDNHHSKLSRKERSFIAGVLQHLKAIAALTLPTINSYERTVDHCWTGKWICWGVENRESPIRVCYRPKKGTKKEMDVNFEFKCVDATANPYIALAALLCAGIDGIEKGLELNMPSCQDDPADLSSEARSKLGITERLPDKLEDSLAELKKDNDLVKSIGKDIIQCFIAVKESELAHFKSLSKNKTYETLINRY